MASQLVSIIKWHRRCHYFQSTNYQLNTSTSYLLFNPFNVHFAAYYQEFVKWCKQSHIRNIIMLVIIIRMWWTLKLAKPWEKYWIVRRQWEICDIIHFTLTVDGRRRRFLSCWGAIHSLLSLGRWTEICWRYTQIAHITFFSRPCKNNDFNKF